MTIIFDFDGTLADSLEVVVKLYNQIAADYGFRQIHKADWPKVRRMGIGEAMKFTGIKLSQIPKLYSIGKRELIQHADDIELYPDILEVIKVLKHAGHDLYLLSTNSNQVVKRVLKKYELDSDIKVLKTPSLFGKARSIRQLLRRHHLDPSKVWMVGDEVRDIEAAHRAGVKILSVSWGLQDKAVLAKEGYDALAKTPEDIVRIINSA